MDTNTGFIVWLIVLVVCPLLIAKADAYRKKTKGISRAQVLSRVTKRMIWLHEEDMPRVLQNSTIFLNEQEVSIESPIRLHGRVDQVYRTAGDMLIPVDTKTRDRFCVYRSDIIQLSVYGMILRYMNAGRYKVSGTGYIRVVIVQNNGERIKYMPVKLLPDKDIIALYQRNITR